MSQHNPVHPLKTRFSFTWIYETTKTSITWCVSLVTCLCFGRSFKEFKLKELLRWMLWCVWTSPRPRLASEIEWGKSNFGIEDRLFYGWLRRRARSEHLMYMTSSGFATN